MIWLLNNFLLLIFFQFENPVRDMRGNKSNLYQTQALQALNTVGVYRELHGKITDRKKIVKTTISFEIKFSYLKCVANVSLVPILEPFRCRLVKLFETVTPPKRKADHSLHCWPDVTPQIAFSSTGKVPNRNKDNSSIRPNKFYSKYVCFGSRKTREERKICIKIHLFCIS